jgi:predicted RNase H-like HicB family nuclease
MGALAHGQVVDEGFHRVTEYGLYLESGPQHKKTMVHVLDLLGCMANGPTTGEAIEATQEAIRAYLRFLKGCGEAVDPKAEFTTSVKEHVTQGTWLGNGSPYLMFGPDFDPVTERDLKVFTHRFEILRETLAGWAERQTDEKLDFAPPEKGRTSRAVLIHLLGTPGAYVSAMVGGVPGVSRTVTMVERGQMPIAEGIRQVRELVSRKLRETTKEQRRAVIERGQMVRTLRKAIRRTLEHDWEHLAELSRRPGGPEI